MLGMLTQHEAGAYEAESGKRLPWDVLAMPMMNMVMMYLISELLSKKVGVPTGNARFELGMMNG